MPREHDEKRADADFVYRPHAVDPLLMMVIVLVALVTLIGFPVTLVDRPEYNLYAMLGPAGALICFSPLIALVLVALALRPTDFVVSDAGLRMPAPRAATLGRPSPVVRFEDVRNVFLTSVEFAGAKLSPFASSAGTVLHIGIGVETKDGRTRTAKFTPTHILIGTRDPKLCLRAREEIKKRLEARGLRMIQRPPGHDEEALARLLAEAQEPLLPFPLIVSSFFIIPFVAFVALYATELAAFPTGAARILLAAGCALVPAVVMFRSAFRHNARREAAIHEIAKFREWKEETGEESLRL